MDNATLKVNVNALVKEPCSITLQIEVPAEEALTVYNKVEKQMAAKASLPGFRPGKLPTELLRRQFGKRITVQASEELISQGYDAALEQSGYKGKVAGSPKVADDSLEKIYEYGKPFAYNVEIETVPEFDLPEYKGLKVKRFTFEIKDEDIDKQADYFLQMSVKYEKSEEPAKEDDVLTLSYEAKLPEGLVVPDNYASIVKNEQGWYPMRTPENLPGAMAVLLGKKADEECDADITFPDDYHLEELRGKTLSYHFKVKEIRKQIKPELNDEFASRFGVKDVAGFRELLKKQMESEMAGHVRSAMVNQITDQLFKDLSFPLPPKILSKATVDFLSDMIEEEKRKGTSREDITAKKDEMQAEATKKAEEGLRQQYMLDAIMKAENINFTKEDYDVMLKYFASQADKSKKLQQIFQEKQESGEMSRFINNILMNKLFTRLIELADVEEAPLKEETTEAEKAPEEKAEDKQ